MSTTGYTLKTSIKLIENWANSHVLIKRYSFGTIEEADLGKTDLYPWIHIAPSSISYEAGSRKLSIDIMIADLVKDKTDKQNTELDVINNCALLMEDLISTFENSQDMGDNTLIDKPITVTPFFNNFTNNLAGVECTLTAEIDFTFDYCLLTDLLNG
jgi:hypothetical protein